MHILLGALAGALFAVVVTVGMSLITGRKPSLKQLLLAGLGGAVGGAIGAATLGVGGMAGATIARQAVAFTAGGAGGGAAEQVADNVIEGQPLDHHLVRATAVGAGTGLMTLGVSKGGAAVFGKVAPRLSSRFVAAADGPMSIPARVVTAPTPGTGSGYISWWDRFLERRENERLARQHERLERENAARRAGQPEQDAPAPGIVDALRMSQARGR